MQLGQAMHSMMYTHTSQLMLSLFNYWDFFVFLMQWSVFARLDVHRDAPQ